MLEKFRKIKFPAYLTWEGWDVWHKDMKESRPVMYALQVEFPRWMKVHVVMPVSEAYYKLASLLWRRQHILDLRCFDHGVEYTYGYIDPVESLLIAPFKIFENFYEKEYVPNKDNVSWPKDVELEIEELYHWWKRARLQKRREFWNSANSKDKSVFLIEFQFNMEDDEMLSRLFKIRSSLWI